MNLELPGSMVPRVQAYLALLEDWNRIHALTALPAEARFEELFLDVLPLLEQLNGLPPGARVVDFGTGMGIPAVPVALARPDLEVVALDAAGKKIAFVRQVALELGLSNLRPVQGRAERLAPLHADLGMAKAVGTLSLLLGWWERHRKPGAPFLALKGEEALKETAPGAWHLELFPYDLPTRGKRVLVRLTT